MPSIQIPIPIPIPNQSLPLLVQANWDPEASVWVAISDEVPGLATEAATLPALEARLKMLVPELLEANGC